MTTGHDEELAAFCAREWPRLVGALRLAYGDQGLAEDLAQDALERVCRRWRRVQAMDRPEAWVRRVAFNAAASTFRRADAGRRALQRHGPDASELPAPEPELLAVRDALAALDQRPRTAVVLRYYLDMTPAEAGAVMGCSGQAVRNLTHRAVGRLRDVLGPDGWELGTREEAASDAH